MADTRLRPLAPNHVSERFYEVKCFASRHGESVVGRTRGEGDRYIGVAESPRRPLPGILTLELIHHKRVMMA